MWQKSPGVYDESIGECGGVPRRAVWWRSGTGTPLRPPRLGGSSGQGAASRGPPARHGMHTWRGLLGADHAARRPLDTLAPSLTIHLIPTPNLDPNNCRQGPRLHHRRRGVAWRARAVCAHQQLAVPPRRRRQARLHRVGRSVRVPGEQWRRKERGGGAGVVGWWQAPAGDQACPTLLALALARPRPALHPSTRSFPPSRTNSGPTAPPSRWSRTTSTTCSTARTRSLASRGRTTPPSLALTCSTSPGGWNGGGGGVGCGGGGA